MSQILTWAKNGLGFDGFRRHLMELLIIVRTGCEENEGAWKPMRIVNRFLNDEMITTIFQIR